MVMVVLGIPATDRRGGQVEVKTEVARGGMVTQEHEPVATRHLGPPGGAVERER